MTLINLDNEAAGVLDMVGRIFGVVRDEREAVGAFLDRMLQHSRQMEASLRDRANAAEDRIKRRADEDLADSRQLFRQAIANQTDLQRLITDFFVGTFTEAEPGATETGGEEERGEKVIEMTMNGHAARLTGTEG